MFCEPMLLRPYVPGWGRNRWFIVGGELRESDLSWHREEPPPHLARTNAGYQRGLELPGGGPRASPGERASVSTHEVPVARWVGRWRRMSRHRLAASRTP